MVFHSNCISFHSWLEALISSFQTVLSSPGVWYLVLTLILTLRSCLHLFIIPLPIFVSLHILFFISFLSLSYLLYLFLPGHHANTSNVMIECKCLILFSKTTFISTSPSLCLVSQSPRLRTSKLSVTHISCFPSTCQLKTKFFSNLLFPSCSSWHFFFFNTTVSWLD